MFALAIIDKDYVGVCSLPATGGAITTCLTDTIRYVEPDGTKATAQLVSRPRRSVDVVIPNHAVAGVPVTLSANA